MTPYRRAFFMIMALQVLDVTTTAISAHLGGYEANPFMAWMIGTLGAAYWWLPKLAIAGLAASILARRPWSASIAIGVGAAALAVNAVTIIRELA